MTNTLSGVREEASILFAYGLLLMKQQDLQEARYILASQFVCKYTCALVLVSAVETHTIFVSYEKTYYDYTKPYKSRKMCFISVFIGRERSMSRIFTKFVVLVCEDMVHVLLF